MPMYEGRQANAEALLKSAEKDLEEARAHLARFRENVEKQARADRTKELAKELGIGEIRASFFLGELARHEEVRKQNEAFARLNAEEAKKKSRAIEFAACLLEEAVGADDTQVGDRNGNMDVELVADNAAWVTCRVYVRL
jgi:hypothetical protein